MRQPTPVGDDGGIETLECDDHEEKEGTHASTAFDKQRPVARRAAREQAQAAALAEAMAAADTFLCPEGCPEKRLKITLSRLYDRSCGEGRVTLEDGTIEDVQVCRCSCSWTVRIDCVKNKISGFKPTGSTPFDTNPEVKKQDLECDEEFVARGMELGVGIAVSAQVAEDNARAIALKNAQAAISAVNDKIICSSRSCPDRELNIITGPVTSSVSAIAGKPLGVNTAIARCPWAVRITCDG